MRGSTRRDVGSVVGADTVRAGYPGYVAGATFAKALGWQGSAGDQRVRRVRVGGAGHQRGAGTDPFSGLADVVLVSSAPTRRPRDSSVPAGDRPDDPDWLRFRVLGATNPTYFGLYARRRMAVHGDTLQDRAGQGEERRPGRRRNARYRKRVTAEEVAGSAVVADPLRLLDICATSDGGAALVLSSMDFARRHGARRTPYGSARCRR